MKKTIEKLQQKDHRTKHHIAFGISLGFTILIFLVWFLSSPFQS